MITISCANADLNELREFAWSTLVECSLDAVFPLFNEYEKYGFDFTGCSSDEEKQRRFVEFALKDMVSIQIVEASVVLNDDLTVEGFATRGGFDLNGFAHAIKKEYPAAEIYGEGEIDYHFSLEPYQIYTDGENVIYQAPDGEDWEEETNEEPDANTRPHHFTDDMPLVYVKEFAITSLISYGRQCADKKKVKLPLSIIIGLRGIKLIHIPAYDYALQEAQDKGVTAIENAESLTFLYQADDNWEVYPDEIKAIGITTDTGEERWVCCDKSFEDSLEEYVAVFEGANEYIQENNLFETYQALDQYEILRINIEDGELRSETMIL